MQGSIAFTNAKSFSSIYFMFVDEYNKLIISKNLQKSLLESDYVIYSGGASIPSTESLDYLDQISTQTIIEHAFNFFILLDDLTVICIIDSTSTESFIKYVANLTDISNVRYISNWDYYFVLLTTDNVAYFACSNHSSNLRRFKFKKTVKFIKPRLTELYILYEDNSMDTYEYLNDFEKYGNYHHKLIRYVSENTKIILDIFVTYRFILLLYDDNTISIKLVMESNSSLYNTLTPNTITYLYETDNNVYMHISNNKSENIGLVTILKNVKIVDCYSLNQKEDIDNLFILYPNQNRITLPFFKDSMKEYAFKILETSNCKYVLFREHACILILQDNSFKIIDTRFYTHFAEIDDIFPKLNNSYKIFDSSAFGSYI